MHNKGSPPFRNHSSIGTLKSNFQAGVQLRGMEGWDPDLRGMKLSTSFFAMTIDQLYIALLSQLITRSPNNPVTRPTPDTLTTHSFFNSLPISTLNFLERSNFASKSREEKIAFMKGLTGVLGRFSKGLRERKILGALLEEVCATSIQSNSYRISCPLLDEGPISTSLYTAQCFQYL